MEYEKQLKDKLEDTNLYEVLGTISYPQQTWLQKYAAQQKSTMQELLTIQDIIHLLQLIAAAAYFQVRTKYMQAERFGSGRSTIGHYVQILN